MYWLKLYRLDFIYKLDKKYYKEIVKKNSNKTML